MDLDTDFDYEKGVLVYEVDFEYAGREYEYDINAYTGKIVWYYIETDPTEKKTSPGSKSKVYDDDDDDEYDDDRYDKDDDDDHDDNDDDDYD